MDVPALIASMQRFAEVLPVLVRGLSEADARWKPADGAWSVLEVVAHLADEETLDFRTRLELTLTNPQQAWPPIDPEGWAVERRYNERDLSAELNRFLTDRRRSLAWLAELREPDWSIAHAHPKFGPIPAGMLLGAWAAHDLLHLRQVTKRLYQLADQASAPYPTLYAGSWTA